MKYTSQAQLGGSELRAFKAKLAQLLTVAPAGTEMEEPAPVQIASR